MKLILRNLSVLLFVLITLSSITDAADDGRVVQRRHKRSVILLPANSSITVTFDLSMPVYPLQSQSGFYNMRVPFRFFIPSYNQLTAYYGKYESKEFVEDNQIERFHVSEQERANEERRFIYKNLESLLSGFGVDGMSCVQRAICELSAAPIFHNDLFGNVLNLIFTPPRMADFSRWISGHKQSEMKTVNKRETSSSDNNELHNDASEVFDDEMTYKDEYETAYHHGKRGLCREEYAQTCPISLFSTFDV